jgi:hypothetical protein
MKNFQFNVTFKQRADASGCRWYYINILIGSIVILNKEGTLVWTGFFQDKD